MVTNLVKKILGSRNQRLLKGYGKIVKQINALEDDLVALSDEALAAKTSEFKQRIKDGATVDQLLNEAFAVVREVSKRTLGMRHFDVQMIGGMVLNNGRIAEMRTGEGKTLSATLPAYLNALTGKAVHVVTVNDYLAKRDAKWMEPVYQFLGMTVGINLSSSSPPEKKQAFKADITYGTNNEFGFDYLRDNMAFEEEDRVMRDLGFAIVDEVDSILIDEARTPLIISGAAEDSSDLYNKVDRLIPHLTPRKEEDGPGDYFLEEKDKQAYLTEQGHQTIENLLIQEKILAPGASLYAPSNIKIMHHINAALRAHKLYARDVDYIVRHGEVVIVDEHTGRTLSGRRWSDGLHQAVEAKEKVKIQNENQTLASITFQNYFRLYDKLSGMTGTADTEAFELQQIYGLEVVVLPTNKPLLRQDFPDQIYLSENEKFAAVVKEIQECLAKKQPVLVGTASIESSESLDKILTQAGIAHQVLNAKFHKKEAEIIAEAGQAGSVTIATNMAGRGTDIVLGGNWEMEVAKLKNPADAQIAAIKHAWQARHDAVVAAGGLHVIGSERHESRRIDNQLRGRCGRQGDPGSTRFFLSMEDNLLRIFASDRMQKFMQRLGMGEGEALEHRWLTKAIENAQRKVEAHNFDIRKELLEYDNVANDQRKVVYTQRRDLMQQQDVSGSIETIRADVFTGIVSQYVPPQSMEDQWDIAGLQNCLTHDYDLTLPLEQWIEEDGNLDGDAICHKVITASGDYYQQKERLVGADVMRNFEKAVLLETLDSQWKDHLLAMDQLREGIHLRGYAGKDPKQEYKKESFELFTEFLSGLKQEIIRILSNVQVEEQADVDAMEAQRRASSDLDMQYHHAAVQQQQNVLVGDDGEGGEYEFGHDQPESNVVQFVREAPKVGRNDPCHCGSGKKFKHCHGKL